MEEKWVYAESGQANYTPVYRYVYDYAKAVRAQKGTQSSTEGEFSIPGNIEMLHAVEGPKKLFAYWKGECVLVKILDLLVRECQVTQRDIGNWCNCDHSNVSLWKKGASMPNKYQWWSLAIAIRLPYKCIPYFLLMIASAYDPFCRDDKILMEISRTGESRRTAYESLMANRCEASAYFFDRRR